MHSPGDSHQQPGRLTPSSNFFLCHPTEGQWWRLKICASDECEWAYYDHSKNRSRNYCEYNCGNKLKTRAYRARQKAAGPASPNTG